MEDLDRLIEEFLKDLKNRLDKHLSRITLIYLQARIVQSCLPVLLRVKGG